MAAVLNSVIFNLKFLRHNLLQTLASFLLFPIVLAFLYGSLYSKNSNTPSHTFKVAVMDEDNSITSKALFNALENFGDNLDFSEESKADYLIKIPKGYENGEEVLIDGMSNSSSMGGAILAMIVEKTSDALKEKIALESVAQNSSEDFKIKLSKIYEELEKNPVKISVLQEAGERKNVFESVSIDVLSLVAIMYLLSIPAANKKYKANGIDKRFSALPMTTAERLFSSLFSAAVLIFIMLVLYTCTLRMAGKAFANHYAQILIILFVGSLFYSLMGVLIDALPFEKITTTLFYGLYIVQIVIANMQNESEMAKLIKQYNFGSFFSEPLKALSRDGNFSQVMNYFCVMGILGAIMLFAAYLILKKRGGKI